MVDLTKLTLRELDNIKNDNNKYINKVATGSGVSNAIPLPGVGEGYDISMLIEAMNKIARSYGLDKESVDSLPSNIRIAIYGAVKETTMELIGKKITAAAIKKILKKMGIRIATKTAAKYVPFVGPVISGVISATAMRKVLKDWNNDCHYTAKKILTRYSSRR